MQTHADQEHSPAPRAEAQGANATSQFTDLRPATASQNRLANQAAASPQAAQLHTIQAMADASPGVETTQRLGAGQTATAQRQAVEEEEPLQGKFAVAQREAVEDEEPVQGMFATVQRQAAEEEEPLQGKFAVAQRAAVEDEEPVQGKFAPVQRAAAEEDELQMKTVGAPEPAAQLQAAAAPRKNDTGLPDNLKSGIESLSGMSMDNVRVHYNSSKPAQLNAYAYAQGTDIHVGPGQEKHLPHEAWHVVQQAQGRVKPTMQMKGGVPVNDDAGLEGEADLMGGKAIGRKKIDRTNAHALKITLKKQTVQMASEANCENHQTLTYKSYKTASITNGDGKFSTIFPNTNTMTIAKNGYASIEPDNPITGTNVSGTTGFNEGIYQDDNYRGTDGKHLTRCHAINADYGGHAIPRNLFPQESAYNSAHSKQIEDRFKAMIINANEKNKLNGLAKSTTDDNYIRAVYYYEVVKPSEVTPTNYKDIELKPDFYYTRGTENPNIKDRIIRDEITRIIPKVKSKLEQLGFFGYEEKQDNEKTGSKRFNPTEYRKILSEEKKAHPNEYNVESIDTNFDKTDLNRTLENIQPGIDEDLYQKDFLMKMSDRHKRKFDEVSSSVEPIIEEIKLAITQTPTDTNFILELLKEITDKINELNAFGKKKEKQDFFTFK